VAVLTFSQLETLMKERAQVGASTDNPLSATQVASFLNDAYADVWDISGGSLKRVASATAWTSAESATGVVTGVLTDVSDVIAVFASTTSGSTGYSTDDNELDRVELERIHYLRSSSRRGSYARPQVYAVSRKSTSTAADVGKLQLDYYPGVTGFYFPIHYKPQFAAIDSSTVTTPDVNDLESRDIALIAAARLCPLLGKHHLVPSILADVSSRTGEKLRRKLQAMMNADQDDAAVA